MKTSNHSLDNDLDLSVGELGQVMQTFVEGNHRFMELKGLSMEDMEAIYATAYTLYDGGRYADAEKVFKALCLFDHMERKHWMGLGSTRQMLKNYQGAIDAYGMAVILNVHDPLAPLQSAECHLALGNVEPAKNALECAIEYAGNNHKAKARAEALLSFLKNNVNQSK